MTDAPIPTPTEERPRQPAWVTPLAIAASMVALALASFGLGRTTADETVRMAPADMSTMMANHQGAMPGMAGMAGMPCPYTTTTTP